jgi:uncharacterized protein with HEPN domain
VPTDPTILIRDCLAEIAVLHEIAARMTLQTFRNDPIARRAAAYASRRPCGKFPLAGSRTFPTEPWGQIKGIGNRIRHEYFRIDEAILWETFLCNSWAGAMSDAVFPSSALGALGL